MSKKKKIAVLIPAWNEEATIKKVIQDFQEQLPSAVIYLFDNNSTDLTKKIALSVGAIVVDEYRQGKGNVVRSMFRTIDADYYVIVDADDTYFAKNVHELLEPVISGKADMVVGNRHASKAYQKENKRKFHQFGNWFVTFLINRLFSSNLKDILSGYRVFNRFFVKTFPIICEGFEIETHLTLHALSKRFKIQEVSVNYQDRPTGSVSKLDTYLDGMRVLKTIFIVFKNYKPLTFFSTLSLILSVLSILIGIQPIYEYIQYSYVFKVPSAILAASFGILAMLALVCGVILDTVIAFHKEQYESMLNLIHSRND